jgi:glycosyltransferase involved in cell wall biosynthesis
LALSQATINRVNFPMNPGLLRYAVNEAAEFAASVFGGRFDVYHPTYFRRLPTVRANRTVTTVCDCTYEQLPHLFRDRDLVIRSRRTMFKKADMFVCISEATRQCLLRFYPIALSQTRVIHLGLSRLPRSIESARELQSLMRRRFLLFVGVRNFHKNFAAVLQAFRDSRLYEDYDLLTLGGGALHADEKSMLARLGLADCVICIPSVTDSFLAEAYTSAALFVYPSLSEGFGLPPLEAMAAGCPVAASNVSAIPEVCRDAPFYFDPYDAGSIAIALLAGVAEGAERSSAIARGERVAAGYSWEECGAKTLAVYRECQ